MLESTNQLANAKFFEFYDISFKAKDYQTIRDTLLKTTVWVTFVGSKKSPTQIFFRNHQENSKKNFEKKLTEKYVATKHCQNWKWKRKRNGTFKWKLQNLLPKNTAQTGNESEHYFEKKVRRLLLSENWKVCCQKTLPKHTKLEMKANIISKKKFKANIAKTGKVDVLLQHYRCACKSKTTLVLRVSEQLFEDFKWKPKSLLPSAAALAQPHFQHYRCACKSKTAYVLACVATTMPLCSTIEAVANPKQHPC